MVEQKNITALSEEEDVLLPDGWHEGVDLFAEEKDTWELSADEREDRWGTDSEEDEDREDSAPTTEQGETRGDHGVDFETQAPTTESGEKQPNMLRFKARVDRKDLDVELNESELPAVYQKAQVTDRMQARLAQMMPRMERAEEMARTMGYHSLDAMLEASGGNGQTGSTPGAVRTPARDFHGEARALLAARPELKGRAIPDQVVRDCVGGKNLLAAYAEYEAGQSRAEADRLRRENEVLRQNAAAAARAPVNGVGGGERTDSRGEDDFLRGFLADD